jgi:hypothetical protein
MHKHLLTAFALAGLWALPVSAHGGATELKARPSPCRSAHSEDRAQAPAARTQAAQAPGTDAPTGGFLARGWSSFFSRPSSPLLP